jgi:hypothetical protein
VVIRRVVNTASLPSPIVIEVTDSKGLKWKNTDQKSCESSPHEISEGTGKRNYQNAYGDIVLQDPLAGLNECPRMDELTQAQ